MTPRTSLLRCLLAQSVQRSENARRLCDLAPPSHRRCAPRETCFRGRVRGVRDVQEMIKRFRIGSMPRLISKRKSSRRLCFSSFTRLCASRRFRLNRFSPLEPKPPERFAVYSDEIASLVRRGHDQSQEFYALRRGSTEHEGESDASFYRRLKPFYRAKKKKNHETVLRGGSAQVGTPGRWDTRTTTRPRRNVNSERDITAKAPSRGRRVTSRARNCGESKQNTITSARKHASLRKITLFRSPLTIASPNDFT